MTKVSHHGPAVFTNLSDLEATQYHSLHADIGDSTPGKAGLWELTQQVSVAALLVLLDATNGPILMGLRQATKPFSRLQLYSSSIRT